MATQFSLKIATNLHLAGNGKRRATNTGVIFFSFAVCHHDVILNLSHDVIDRYGSGLNFVKFFPKKVSISALLILILHSRLAHSAVAKGKF